jgi:hypothetical protein
MTLLVSIDGRYRELCSKRLILCHSRHGFGGCDRVVSRQANLLAA